MKIPRVRFTVRWIMVAVAVAALAFGIVRLWALRQLYLEKAANHAGFTALIIRSPRPSNIGNPDGRRNARDCPRGTRGLADLRSCHPWPSITMQ